MCVSWVCIMMNTCLVVRFRDLTGGLLLEVRRMQVAAPESFYSSLRADLLLDFVTMMKFTKALSSLREWHGRLTEMWVSCMDCRMLSKLCQHGNVEVEMRGIWQETPEYVSAISIDCQLPASATSTLSMSVLSAFLHDANEIISGS